MIDKIKSDLTFRNKVIRITLILLIFIIGVVIILLVNDDSKKNKLQRSNVIIDNLIPADTTPIIDDKEAIYRDSELFRKRREKTIDLVNNSDDFSLRKDEIIQKQQKKQADKIDEYMTKRRLQIAKNEQIARRNEKEDNQYMVNKLNNKNQQYHSKKQGHRRNKKVEKKKSPDEIYKEYINGLENDLENDLINKNKEEEEAIEVRAVVYLDQFLLPGDRARLILPKDTNIFGTIYQKGTDIYATVSVFKSRLLLNITNINHNPVELVAKDIEDGEIGVYNEQAGKLWREYQEDIQEQTIKDLSGQISKNIQSSLLTSSINSLTTFFSRKKNSNRQKMLLLNDHEVILIIKPKKNEESKNYIDY